MFFFKVFVKSDLRRQRLIDSKTEKNVQSVDTVSDITKKCLSF